MHRGDIYFVDLDPTVGHEQSGYRPVLIVSPYEFNVAFRTPWVCPITTRGKPIRDAGFAVELVGLKKIQGYVLCNQLGATDLTARKAKFQETAPEDIIEAVLAKLRGFLE
jgi:mRNA interferase ChpB